jgi:hypothetical protein
MAKKTNRRSALRSLMEIIRSWWKPRPEPEDPFAYRMAPVRRGPKDRSGTAVVELEE